MMKNLLSLTVVLLLVGTMNLLAQEKKYTVYAIGFYNLENLFDTVHDEGYNDYAYLPDGLWKWGTLKYMHKLRNMARVLSEMGTDRLPDVGCAAIGVSEVENARCLTDLCNQEPLKKRGFKFCHVEGPDRRGMDCALLYNPTFFTVRNVKLVPYVYTKPEDSKSATRGFLVVSGTIDNEHVTIIVNYLPSRFAGSFYREEGGRQIRQVKDSLLKDDPNVKIIIMGDMNDDPSDRSMAVALGAQRKLEKVKPGGLFNPFWDIHADGKGTLTYDGKWNLFDQIILSYSLLTPQNVKDYSTLKYYQAQIFRRDYLFQQEGRHKGNLLRTHAGSVWQDGYSDHLPTLVYLIKEKNEALEIVKNK